MAQSSKSEDANLKNPAENASKPTVENPEKEDVIRIETNLIINEVLVFDKKGNPVKDLQISDFTIKENDKPQEISIFSFGATESIPRSIVLIIDYSGSQLPYIKTSIEAAKVLVDKISPLDRMAIVTDNIKLIQNFTTDKTLLKEKLESLKTSALAGEMGQSRQYSALMKVLNEMFTETDYRPIIIFQTDGDELGKLKDSQFKNFVPEEERAAFSFEDVITATDKTRATVYSIIPGIRFFGVPDNEQLERSKKDALNNELAFSGVLNKPFKPEELKLSGQFLRARASWCNRQQSSLNQIAQITGGLTYFLEQPEQADKVYSEILSGINVRYLIGYYPTNPTRDGKRRKVSIELSKYPEYKIWGRKTYILEEK
ncbi:MAG TPA: VWA domain-containing protein [Pyrinomonadaceae bacterium]